MVVRFGTMIRRTDPIFIFAPGASDESRMTRNRNVCRIGDARQRYGAFLWVSDNGGYAPRDLSFIEIVTAWSAVRSRLFHIIERQDPAALPRGE